MTNNTELESPANEKMDKTKALILAGVVLWPSFLVSVAATIFFFSMFDPKTLGEVTTWPISLDRGTGYTIGFFLFWLMTLASSVTSAWLLITQHHKIV